MAEDFDSGALSQEALDALMNSVEGVQPETAPPATPDLDATAADEPDFAFEAQAAAAPEPTPASLHMASFDFPDAPIAGGMGSYNRVQDIPLEITVELGRTKLLIKDILELGSGSIIELEKVAGEPVDLLANGLLVARGEVVVIEDNFGVRITEIITNADRKVIAEDPFNLSAA
jgi:flagellar motor switch protein FliN/FliY